MRAIAIRTFGDPDGMELVERPEPRPAAGQVLIRTEAIGVGGVDAAIRRGTLSNYGFIAGLIPGSEVAGTVIAVGDTVEQSWLGRRVWASTGTGGGYVELAVADLGNVVALPPALSSIEAVTLGSAAPVAQFALQRGRLSTGEAVLIRGAAGSIGIAAVELAVRAGAEVIAVTTSDTDRGRRLRELGATHVLDRSGVGDAPAAYDVIVDIVGGPEVPVFIRRLAPNGRMITVGMVAGEPPANFGTAILEQFLHSISYATLSLATIPPAELAQARADAFTSAIDGTLHPVVYAMLPLDAAAQAHRRMDAGEVFGRIVLVP